MLANVAFQNFKKVWCQSKIPLQKKLMVYEARVISILMDNSIIIIINFTADTANDYPKSFKVSAILNTPQVNLKL